MALQDNFNAVYNKKEAAKIERERLKQFDKKIEIEFKEDLQKTIEAYIEDGNSKSKLFLLNVKHKIIENTTNGNDWRVDKKSKYTNIDNIKIYLDSVYDKTARKTIKIFNDIDKEIEEAEEIKNILIEEPTEEIQETETKKGMNPETLQNLRFVLLLIVLAPLFLLWGIIEGLCKKK